MRQKIILQGILCIAVFLITLPCSGGDIAAFVNLGFSSNSEYFMFAQYGLKEADSSPYADLFIVDVKANIFAPYGTKSLDYKQPVEPGNTGLGALFTIMEQNIALKTRYGIDHLSTGRIVYHLIDGDKNEEPILFRDFISNKHYKILLHQKAAGQGKNVESSFHIDLTITRADGSSKTYTIGHPAYKRKGVKNYKIRQIILAPDEQSLVFLIEKEEADTKGANIRYMVETVKTGI
jgi:predicted secreted protein